MNPHEGENVMQKSVVYWGIVGMFGIREIAEERRAVPGRESKDRIGRQRDGGRNT
jgi:hypothetical protein